MKKDGDVVSKCQKDMPVATQKAGARQNHLQTHPRNPAPLKATSPRSLSAWKAGLFVSFLSQARHYQQHLLVAVTLQIVPAAM